MNKLFSKFTKLLVNDAARKLPFAIINSDNERGLYVKEFIKALKQFPSLIELNEPGIHTKKLRRIEEDDVIIFGDAIAPYDFDYHVVELKDLKTTNGLPVYDLVDEFDAILKILEEYYEENYPDEYDELVEEFRNPKKDYVYVTHYARRKPKKQKKTRRLPTPKYYSAISGKSINLTDLELGLEIPRSLLKRYKGGEIEVELEITRKSSRPSYKKSQQKKKVSGKQYVVHQNVVKAGLKMYNIFRDHHNNEYVNIAGREYEVVRRSGKKDYLRVA